MMKACPNWTRFLHTKERNRINGKNHRRKDKTSTSIKIASDLDLCQYFEHKKLKGYADFFNSSSSFCCGVI